MRSCNLNRVALHFASLISASLVSTFRFVVLEKGIMRYYENKADYDAGRQCIKNTTINATLAAFRDDDDVRGRRFRMVVLAIC